MLATTVTSLKENRKGWTRSYNARRAAFVIGSVFAVTGSVFQIFHFLGGINNRTRGKGTKQVSGRRGFFSGIYVDAAEVGVSADGETVPLHWPVDNSLKSAAKARDSSDDEDGDVPPEKDSLLLLQVTNPRLTYGTAWKKERTSDLVYKAVRAGFRHIDTACQPKHYNEPGVGQGWSSAANDLGLKREDFWLQTKYTSLNGQDPTRIPYDRNAPLDEQVRQSLAKSLENLRTDYLDSLVMHGMEDSWAKNLLVWKTFESFVDEGKVRQIGISNCYDPDAVRYLYTKARIKPKVVQNRFYADTGYDTAIRQFCFDKDIEYQSFWTLGANRHALNLDNVRALADKKSLTPETLMYAFVIVIGITPLDGTTSEKHMAEDIALLERIRSGDKIFRDSEELSIVARALDIPGWR